MNLKSEINHALLFYYEICRLRRFNEFYESTIISILEDFTYILDGDSVIFSSETVELFDRLNCQLQEYYKNVSYSNSPALKFIDLSYKVLLDQYQLPLLDSVEKDFLVRGIDYEKCSRQEIDRPSDEDIIKSVDNLYKKLNEYESGR
ncbi:MAG: hypothetical protein H6559_06650 [Lewinellaceae bacterium]|nr:hypothetical protein [Lewinellaceae bacterium]